ncbi:hypothetical protein AB0N73_09220 [Microbacterium sp. NPDC089189]
MRRLGATLAGSTPEDDLDVQPDDAERFDATLSGRITCEEQVSLPGSD